MESLVEIAKSLGIQPIVHMDELLIKQALDKIYKELYAHCPAFYQNEIAQKPFNTTDTFSAVYGIDYDRHKKVQNLIQNAEQFEKNIAYFKQAPEGMDGDEQMGFLLHIMPDSKGQKRERFVATIQLDSVHFIEMIGQLDQFAKKYSASYKIPDKGNENRSDTLTVRLPYDITPEIAKEFLQIIRPCLVDTFDDYLNGRPLLENGTAIKGVRIGPEYMHLYMKSVTDMVNSMKRTLLADLGVEIEGEIHFDYKEALVHSDSLGQKEAILDTLNLAYYLVGKEGRNPYQLMSYDRKTPYRKYLEIGDGKTNVMTPVMEKVQVISNTVKPSATEDTSPKIQQVSVSEKKSDFDVLSKELSQEILKLRQEMNSCHQEISDLKSYQNETRQHVKNTN